MDLKRAACKVFLKCIRCTAIGEWTRKYLKIHTGPGGMILPALLLLFGSTHRILVEGFFHNDIGKVRPCQKVYRAQVLRWVEVKVVTERDWR